MANTSAPLSEVAIANMAADILAEPAILSLDDGGPFADFIARQFGYVRDQIMRGHPWHFNRTIVQISVDLESPAFQWKYKYTLPTDYLRLYPLRTVYPNGPKIPYQLMSGAIYTDQSAPLYIMYGKRITNAAQFDPLFAALLAARLARLGAHRIPGKASYYADAANAEQLAYYNAVHTNSLESGVDDYADNGYDGAGFDTDTVRGYGLS